MTDTTNPDADVLEEVVDDQSEDQVSDQGQDDSLEGETEGEEDEASQDDEYDEYEEDGKTYKVPKDLKGHLLRNADYTKKTQELAEQRKALEAQVTKVREDDEAIESAKYSLRGIQSRLADLQALSDQDWAYLQQNRPQDYDKLQREFMTLPRQAEEAKRKLDEKTQEVAKAQQEITAKRISEGHEVLQRDIPGWGPELGAKLTEFVGKEFGITAERHGEAFMDPALIKLAHAAYQAKGDQRKQAALKSAETAKKVVPIKPSRGGALPATGLDDRLSTDEWIKRDRELTAKKMGLSQKR